MRLGGYPAGGLSLKLTMLDRVLVLLIDAKLYLMNDRGHCSLYNPCLVAGLCMLYKVREQVFHIML